MIKVPIYQVDAFATKLFAGNPAAVCPLEEWLDDATLQSVAAENNLSETAYIIRNANGYEIRWFTPAIEVALCGHATLASAFVVFNRLGWAGDTVTFQTRKCGDLAVRRDGDLLTMNFPAQSVLRREGCSELEKALGVDVEEVYEAGEDLMLVVKSEAVMLGISPDFALLEGVAQRGIIVTAQGESCDFVSRFFAPAAGIPEDPVTGSAHCALAPYWAKRLKKETLHARQVSTRGGELFCELKGDRVLISGRAVLYMEGQISV